MDASERFRQVGTTALVLGLRRQDPNTGQNGHRLLCAVGKVACRIRPKRSSGSIIGAFDPSCQHSNVRVRTRTVLSSCVRFTVSRTVDAVASQCTRVKPKGKSLKEIIMVKVGIPLDFFYNGKSRKSLRATGAIFLDLQYCYSLGFHKAQQLY